MTIIDEDDDRFMTAGPIVDARRANDELQAYIAANPWVMDLPVPFLALLSRLDHAARAVPDWHPGSYELEVWADQRARGIADAEIAIRAGVETTDVAYWLGDRPAETAIALGVGSTHSGRPG